MNNIQKVISILDKKMNICEGQTVEAISIVFTKLYLLGFVTSPQNIIKSWTDTSNYIISKIHNSLYSTPGTFILSHLH